MDDHPTDVQATEVQDLWRLTSAGYTDGLRAVLQHLEHGEWEQALAIARIDHHRSWGRSVLQTVAQHADVVGRLEPPMVRAVLAIWLGTVCRGLWGDVPAALLAASLLQHREHIPAIADYFAKLRARVPTGAAPLAHADWDSSLAWVNTTDPTDEVGRWYTGRLAELSLPVAAMLVRRLPELVEPSAHPAPGATPTGVSLSLAEAQQLQVLGLYERASPRATLERLRGAQLREIAAALGVATTSRRRADLVATLAARLSPAQVDEYGHQYGLGPGYVCALDPARRGYCLSLNAAALCEARLTLGMLDRFRRSLQSIDYSERHTARLSVRPGPDPLCDDCPRQSVPMRTSAQVPPFHPGCRCELVVQPT